jgi:hypothetical protein
VIALDHPRGDDPYDPWVPVVPSDNQSGSVTQVLRQIPQRCLCRIRNLPLRRPPLTIGPIELNSNLRSSLIVLSQKELHPSIGPVKPPGSVDPRPQPEPEIALVKPARIAFSRSKQRSHPWSLRPANLLEPPLHQRPILTDQRNYIGHCRKRNQIEVGGG